MDELDRVIVAEIVDGPGIPVDADIAQGRRLALHDGNQRLAEPGRCLRPVPCCHVAPRRSARVAKDHGRRSMPSNGKCLQWRRRDTGAGEQVRARNQGHIVSGDAVDCPVTPQPAGGTTGIRYGAAGEKIKAAGGRSGPTEDCARFDGPGRFRRGGGSPQAAPPRAGRNHGGLATRRQIIRSALAPSVTPPRLGTGPYLSRRKPGSIASVNPTARIIALPSATRAIIPLPSLSARPAGAHAAKVRNIAPEN